MRVIVTVRTLNESANIIRFLSCYEKIADEILVADGGSTDDTLGKLHLMDKVSVRPFHERIEHGNGTWSNPRGKHINFLFDWAMERGADWIIFDDCDCVPTVALQDAGREILENCEHDMVFAYRMFVYHDTHWYPQMNYAGQSLWAWRTYVPVRADESRPAVFEMKIPQATTRWLSHPYALLHYFYPSEVEMDRKLAFYAKTGDLGENTIPQHPNTFMGERAVLPEWAKWRNDE